MVASRDEDFKHENVDYVVAGAMSGVITRTLFQPLDVVKIRFQLQIEPISRGSDSSKYKSLFHASRCIFAEEGVKAFWKGIVPAQYLSFSYGSLQFVSFEILTRQSCSLLPDSVTVGAKPAVNFVCGALAGCVATMGSFPFDVIRTRLVGQGEPKTYKSLIHASSVMFRKEGFRSFYKGLIPTLIQISPNAGAQFAFYKFFQEAWGLILNSNSAGVLQSSCCGAAAGIAAKTLVYPLDLIKKRFQIQGFEVARISFGRVRQYKGLVHCISCILREEGISGMYKGLSPSVLKAAFTTGSHFLYYEQTLKVIRYLRQCYAEES